MSELVGKAPVELQETDQSEERTVLLGKEFVLFPHESTINIPDAETGEYDMEHSSSVTIIDPVTGFRLPLLIYGTHSFEGNSGMIGVDIKTKGLGRDLLTVRRKLRKKVFPFIASLRMSITPADGKSEEFIPKINSLVDGISFYLTSAVDSDGKGVGELKARLFSVTAEKS
jgi:hypothetical protein